MNRKLIAAAFAAVLSSVISSTAHAVIFADQAVAYTSGTGIDTEFGTGLPFTNTNAVLGQPNRLVGAGTGFEGVLSPANAPYQSTEMLEVGFGGSLTLQLAQPVLILPGTFELGIFSVAGLNWDFTNNKSTSNASLYTSDNKAELEVSADGTNWVSLGLQTFDMPANGYANATGPFDAAPASPVLADFGKAFTGTRASLGDKTFPEILSILDGSAGGNWYDLDSTGLASFQYVRFSGVPSGTNLKLDGVAAVPEPSTVALAFAGMLGIFLRRRRA